MLSDHALACEHGLAASLPGLLSLRVVYLLLCVVASQSVSAEKSSTLTVACCYKHNGQAAMAGASQGAKGSLSCMFLDAA